MPADAGRAHPPIDESPIAILTRWEEAGAVWRTRSLSEREAIVSLRACTGEEVDELRSSDPALLAYLAGRGSSDDAPA